MLLGNYVVSESTASPFPSEQQRRTPAILFFTYAVFSIIVIFALIPAAGFGEQLSYVMLWGGATALLALYLLRNGNNFVNHPCLVHVKEKCD